MGGGQVKLPQKWFYMLENNMKSRKSSFLCNNKTVYSLIILELFVAYCLSLKFLMDISSYANLKAISTFLVLVSVESFWVGKKPIIIMINI